MVVVFFSCFCSPPWFVPMLSQWKPWGSSVPVLDDNKDLFQARPHGSKQLECLVCWRGGVCAAEVFSCSLTSWAEKASCSLHQVHRNKPAHFTPTNSPCAVRAHCVMGSLQLNPEPQTHGSLYTQISPNVPNKIVDILVLTGNHLQCQIGSDWERIAASWVNTLKVDCFQKPKTSTRLHYVLVHGSPFQVWM